MDTHGYPWRYMSAPGSELHDGWGVSFITTVSFITNITVCRNASYSGKVGLVQRTHIWDAQSGLCGCMAVYLCGYIACGVAMCYVSMWLCIYVAMWLRSNAIVWQREPVSVSAAAPQMPIDAGKALLPCIVLYYLCSLLYVHFGTFPQQLCWYPTVWACVA